MPPVQRVPGRSAQDARAAIESFLKNCRQPALLEPGDELLPLTGDNFVLDLRGSRLTLQAWDRTRNLTRRVTAFKEPTSARLEIVVERFARREGRFSCWTWPAAPGPNWADAAAAWCFASASACFCAASFRSGNWPSCATEANLESSLSPAYPRALPAPRPARLGGHRLPARRRRGGGPLLRPDLAGLSARAGEAPGGLRPGGLRPGRKGAPRRAAPALSQPRGGPL